VEWLIESHWSNNTCCAISCFLKTRPTTKKLGTNTLLSPILKVGGPVSPGPYGCFAYGLDNSEWVVDRDLGSLHLIVKNIGLLTKWRRLTRLAGRMITVNNVVSLYSESGTGSSGLSQKTDKVSFSVVVNFLWILCWMWVWLLYHSTNCLKDYICLSSGSSNLLTFSRLRSAFSAQDHDQFRNSIPYEFSFSRVVLEQETQK